jgi:hypothetical protein
VTIALATSFPSPPFMAGTTDSATEGSVRVADLRPAAQALSLRRAEKLDLELHRGDLVGAHEASSSSM